MELHPYRAYRPGLQSRAVAIFGICWHSLGAFFVSHSSAQVGRETWASPNSGEGPLQKPQTRSRRICARAQAARLARGAYSTSLTLFQSVALLEVLARWPASQPSSADHSPVQRRSGAQRQQHTLSTTSAQYAAQYAIPYSSDTLHCVPLQRPRQQKGCIICMMHILHLYFDLVAELEVHHLAPSMLPPLQSVLPCQPLHWRPHSRRPPCLRRRPCVSQFQQYLALPYSQQQL